jgi:hypothetical protein
MAVAPLPWHLAPAAAAGLRLALAALGMLLLLRSLGVGPLAALFGALAFVGSGSMALLLYHPNSDVSCWLPLAAYLSLRLARRAEAALGALLALVLGAQYLGGHPETSVYVVFVSGLVFLLGRAAPDPRGEPRAAFAEAAATMAVAQLLGLLLAAVQILPFLEYLGESDILGMRRMMRYANAPTAAVGLVSPAIFGTPLRPNTHFGPGNYHDVAMQYTGLATIVLALAGVVLWATHRRRDGRARPADVWTPALAGLAAGALLLAYPTPLWRLAEMAGPLRFSLNVTGLTLLYAFAVCVLGALAVHEITTARAEAEEPKPARRGLGALTLAVAVAAVLALAAGIALPLARTPLLAYGERLLRARYQSGLASQPIEFYLARLGAVLGAVQRAILVTGALGVGAALLLWLRRRLPATGFALLAIALLAVDLAQFGRGYLPAIDVTDALPASRATTLLQEAGEARVLPTGRAFPPNSLTLWGVEDVRLSDAMGTAKLTRYLAPPADVHPLRQRFADYRRRLIDAAGVDVVASEEPLRDPDLVALTDSADGRLEGLYLYRNLAAWPHAFLVEREEGATDDEAAVARTLAAARLSAAGGARGMGHALPSRVVLSAGRAGVGLAPEPLWRVVERLYPALRARRGPAAEPEGEGRPASGWLGDPRFSPGRLWGKGSICRQQGAGVGEGGTLLRGPLSLDAEVETAHPGWLVVLDQDYPGWDVRVDGSPAEGLCAYGLFRAVALEPGRHRVTWSYRPESFALGLCLSLIALAATLVWLALAVILRPNEARGPAGR